MKYKKKIKILLSINWIKFLVFNFFSKNVIRNGKGFIIPNWKSVLVFGKQSKIILYDGHLVVNQSKPRGAVKNAIIKLEENAELECKGQSYLCYGATIEVHKDARVILGSAYINSDAVILAAESITIGENVLISREVYIYDADHHPIFNEKDEVINPPKPVVIGNHVWIGLKAILLRGSKIGEGAVIAAGSVVSGKIKSGTMASGNPARAYWNVKWKD